MASQGPTQELLPDDFDSESPALTPGKVWARLLPTNNNFSRVDISDNVVTFGRKSDCTITFKTEPAISGRHCRLVKEDDDGKTSEPIVWIYDTSTNGTFMKGKKIGKGKRALLSHGTEFCLIPGGNKRDREAISYLFMLNKHDDLHGGVYDSYELRGEIGTGAFATVYRCINKSTGKKYAMKNVDKKKFSLKARSTRKDTLMDEVDILKTVDHPNIIKVYEVFDTPEKLHIVLELALGGDLFDRVVSMRRYPEDRARDVMRQMLDAIMYLHKHKIVHRDLKPENILMANQKSDPKDVIKLSDFGLSRLVGDQSFIKTICGTPQYIAPELLNSARGYTKDVDYWSIGVILYILLSGAPPFHDHGDKPILDQVKTGDYKFPESLFKDVSESGRNKNGYHSSSSNNKTNKTNESHKSNKSNKSNKGKPQKTRTDRRAASQQEEKAWLIDELVPVECSLIDIWP